VPHELGIARFRLSPGILSGNGSQGRVAAVHRENGRSLLLLSRSLLLLL
jgi:hypothetical protein